MSTLIFLAQASAIPAPVSGDLDIAAFFKLILDAVKSGNWMLVASLGVVALTWLARVYGGKFWPFLSTGAGASMTVVLLGVSGSVSSALLAGASPSPETLLRGLEVGLAAAGGYATVKKAAEQFFPKWFSSSSNGANGVVAPSA